ncbi:uncharacterized protein LOC126882949 [Diabrotica virgifera virgifera]|uniref:Uncharacterized protein n=1 Tax=Diabrotica virgifera virgifera TaxID=50390 RepID=A0ABM5K1B8_DIAVI|nr:uncharacterized protein LOC126882949 [Diabrotica virgifera virgifera]
MAIIKDMMILLTLWLSVNLAMCRENLDDGHEKILHHVLRKFHKRHICQELCSSGLGGHSCGRDCLDVFQQIYNMQQSTSNNLTESHNDNNVPRSDMCPVLCKYHLGKPLCVCSKVQHIVPSKAIDFLEICSEFCNTYNYRISGCQKCSIYQDITPPRKSASGLPDLDPDDIDWNEWCTLKCREGDGGAACACDRGPFGLVS